MLSGVPSAPLTDVVGWPSAASPTLRAGTVHGLAGLGARWSCGDPLTRADRSSAARPSTAAPIQQSGHPTRAGKGRKGGRERGAKVSALSPQAGRHQTSAREAVMAQQPARGWTGPRADEARNSSGHPLTRVDRSRATRPGSVTAAYHHRGQIGQPDPGQGSHRSRACGLPQAACRTVATPFATPDLLNGRVANRTTFPGQTRRAATTTPASLQSAHAPRLAALTALSTQEES